jgi:hypothetical protein
VTNGSLLQVIRDVMPPVFMIDDSMEGCSTQTFPPPLNVRPLPPFMITEKGESLDEFILRKHPDFFTAIQVCVWHGLWPSEPTLLCLSCKLPLCLVPSYLEMLARLRPWCCRHHGNLSVALLPTW